jgi:long-chain acyl-CoA synthetase
LAEFMNRVEPAANLAAMHRGTAQRLGPRPAVRYKANGVYRSVSWREVRRRADRAALGLMRLGLNKGDRVALLSENRFEWVLCDLALLSAGCTTVPLHAPLTAAQVEYQLRHSEVRGVVVSDGAQAAKVRSRLESLPHLELVVEFERTGVDVPLRVLTWDESEHLAGSPSTTAQAEVLERELTITRDDLATILYTSGTTGPPNPDYSLASTCRV